MKSYIYKRHGLLFIVTEIDDHDGRLPITETKDSEWRSEQDAKQHIRILNMTPEEIEKSCKMFSSIPLNNGQYDEICLNCNEHLDYHL